jgi:hypothetical protein
MPNDAEAYPRVRITHFFPPYRIAAGKPVTWTVRKGNVAVAVKTAR